MDLSGSDPPSLGRDGSLAMSAPCDFHRFFGVQTPACTYVEGERPRLDGTPWRLVAWSAPGTSPESALDGTAMTLAHAYATVVAPAPELFGATVRAELSSFDGCRSRTVATSIVGETVAPDGTDDTDPVTDDCPPSGTPAYRRQREAFRRVLASAHAWRIEGDRLALVGADGTALVLEPATARSDGAEAADRALPPVGDAGDARARFANTAWRMTSYGFSADETSIAVPGGEGGFALDFGGVADRSVGGELDCNGYGASLGAHARVLVIELREATDGEPCDRSDPETAAAVSIGYAMVDGALAWSVEGDLLRLEDGAGRHATLLRLEPGASLGERLIGSRWRLFSRTDAEGAELRVPRADRHALALLEDGTARVGLGCGELVGQYLIEPDALGVYAVRDTTPVTGCSGPPAQDPRVEPELRRAFGSGGSLIARVDGTRLALEAGDGRRLVYVRVP